jgi:hypothetical protein
MEPIANEVLRDLRMTASRDGGIVGVVADALEDASIGEEELLAEIAAESGGLTALFGRLWDRVKQVLRGSAKAPPTLRSAVLPPASPPQLTAGIPSSRLSPASPSAVPSPQQQQLANWLTGDLVPRRPPAHNGPPTLRSPTFPPQPTRRRKRGESADVFEAVLEAAIEEDVFEASAPVLAGVALKRAIPQVANLPDPMRRQMIATAATAMRMLAQRSSPHAVRAMPALLGGLHRAMAQRGGAMQGLRQAIPRHAALLAGRPDLIARFAGAAPSRSRR